VADDAPEFRRIAHNTIEGTCPPLLRDFMEVRGLGVLNIRRMYGHAATRHHKVLRFIVRLELMDEFNQDMRLHNSEQTRVVLGVEIAQLTLPVAPGRNLAVLVEAAVRNYLLRKSGYDSAAEFETLQKQLMDSDTPR
jgi:HPr kinase/phosphorylase